ncbi:hypothetical protein M097_2863 [Phocaeicola vulgatus str. 3775 SL(B) 10 (iv)]|uniref:Uncharacterized protein n=1 Tax=Phocaeicola vulgatus str. 3775 SL(B) 10 (iv) TaxID=1339350 RepID=A0A078R2W8_PHOVU|nr:hypothetical protein M097_2863 [Phocaeicola vulgatus str. 3775 SL(B) 10 (iv)]
MSSQIERVSVTDFDMAEIKKEEAGYNHCQNFICLIYGMKEQRMCQN